MQVLTHKENLTVPLSLVVGAADTRGTIPLLGTVLVKASEAGKLSMLCSDLGMVARSQSDVTVKSVGEIAVDVRRFYDLIRAVPDKQAIELSIETKGGKTGNEHVSKNLLLKAGRSKFRIPGFDTADYPRMATTKEKRLSITMSSARLSEMIASVSPAMAENDVRTYLNGTLFLINEKGLTLVATDGFRLAVDNEPIEGMESVEPHSLIVPRKTLLIAKKLLSKGGNLSLSIGEKQAILSFTDGTTLIGKAIVGVYPDWQRLLVSTPEQISFNTDQFATSLAMIGATTEEKSSKSVANCVQLSAEKSVTTLCRGDAGRCEIESASTSDKTFNASFKLSYLGDAISTVRAASEDAVIGFSNEVASIIVRPKDKAYPLVVVMPLRS